MVSLPDASRIRASFFALIAATTFGIPVLTPSLAQAQTQSRQVLHNQVREEITNHSAALIDRLPSADTLHASIVMPLRNQAALNSLLGRLYDPSSPDYRHFLSVAQFTEQFGPTQDDFNAVVGFAQANGLAVHDLPANRLLVPISGTVDQFNSAFHVQMSVYQHPTENRTFFSPDREPSLDLAVPISHISGLDSYSLPQPMYRRASESESQVHGR